MADTRTTHVTYYGPDQDNIGPFRTLLVFTLLMVTAPISLYFMSKTIVFEGMLSMEENDAYFYGAIVAVVVVHIILVMFVVVAFREKPKAGFPLKQD
ncbi:vacuolar ATPase assembly integral membrane protein VMA21-like [Branchiostoma lanceolatum]|uniref:Vacuolar ATPase assembly integral membrane protein VMA21 homolog n=1 Tax=Branchiostoma lanceolatum TaxID=7740 RepID=A0A8K0A3H8_BRALA|nr:Hypp3873 [Branchiostoma lanceolatum]